MPREGLRALARNAHLRAAALRACPPSERTAMEAALDAATPAASRVAGGRAAQRHGVALERWLDAQHAAMAVAGVADVRRAGPPIAYTGRGGARIVVTGVGPADYVGTLRGGRAVAVEAKSRRDRLRIDDVPPHQREHLDAVHALGGLALLVYEHQGPPATIYVVPWADVPWGGPRGGLSVGPTELARWRWRGGIYLARWSGGDP